MTSSIKDTTVTDAPLLPCPFCGGEASVIGIRDGRQVSCKGQPRVPCFAKGPAIYHGPDGWAACEANAIAAWNTRSMEAKPDPEGDGALAAELRNLAEFLPRHSEDRTLVERAADRIALTAKPSLEPTRTELVEALEPFAKVADAFDYWCAEAMPSFSYPEQTCDLKFALEDCPNAVGELTESDFANARRLLSRKQSRGGSSNG